MHICGVIVKLTTMENDECSYDINDPNAIDVPTTALSNIPTNSPTVR